MVTSGRTDILYDNYLQPSINQTTYLRHLGRKVNTHTFHLVYSKHDLVSGCE